MMSAGKLAGLALATTMWLCAQAVLADDKPVTGPETEKRFPPLVVPDGFRATLFACDPLVEYPSVIALGPEPGTLFVAYDYVTGLGVEIVRRDEIRIVRDRDRDGYADETTLYAKGFNSIQGLAYHDGSVFVMHAPLLTALRDTDGDGEADERRDLLKGLGLPPEENSNRLHCANGVVAGHDSWLYLALGDRGCDVQRPEGDRLLFQEGGILRCRPDGRDLHVFSRGLRNIYDIALDEQLNVFVRDNENDGGDYMIRVCHCFFGSDHGYPYLYYERPNEAMRPLADLGRGSSAGGAAYLEMAFPLEYRESLYFCEWGRAVVRYPMAHEGSSFAPMQEIDFAAGAADDPYGFKPTDLVVDYDGSLLISDWGDGQRPKRGRGRIYRISYEKSAKPEFRRGDRDLYKALDSASYHDRLWAQSMFEHKADEAAFKEIRERLLAEEIGQRARMHAVWILAGKIGGKQTIDDLFWIAGNDSSPRVRVQAIRAIADLTDPILVKHRLDAGRGEAKFAERLTELAEGQPPHVLLEVIVAVSRLRWEGTPMWLRDKLMAPDAAVSHAAMQALRSCDNWRAVLKLLGEGKDSADDEKALRNIALRALADQANETVVDGLITRVDQERNPQRRSEYLDLLARVYKRPAEWTYWGFRPAPRPANSVDWERTEQIGAVLDQALQDSDFGVRARTVRRMLRESVPIRFERLTSWLDEDTGADGVAAILEAFAQRPIADTRGSLESVLRSRAHADQNRETALAMLSREADADAGSRLLKIAQSLDEGSVLASTIRVLASQPKLKMSPLLLARLDSKNDDVRAAAIEVLADQPHEAAAPRVVELLNDRDIRVRRAAATLAGKLQVRDAADRLFEFAESPDVQSRIACLESLALLDDRRAVDQAIDALRVAESQAAALRYLARFGSPQHVQVISKAAAKSRSTEVLLAAVEALARLKTAPQLSDNQRGAIEQAIARVQGESGVALQWRVRGPLAADDARRVLSTVVDSKNADDRVTNSEDWLRQVANGTDARIELKASEDSAKTLWLAATELIVNEPADVEFIVSTNRPFRIWLNGRQAFKQDQPPESRSDVVRFDAQLAKGGNRLALELDATSNVEFQLRFRTKSSKAEYERLTRFVLEGRGNADRGRELFLNAEKSQCASCHRIGDQGARIGPDLAGIGGRFSRIHLVESILEPSRTVAPSYETLLVALSNGRVHSGVKVAETETTLTLGDNQGKTLEVSKAEIDEIQHQPLSTMPDGLAQRMSDREFLDLIEFLLSLKNTQPN